MKCALAGIQHVFEDHLHFTGIVQVTSATGIIFFSEWFHPVLGIDHYDRYDLGLPGTKNRGSRLFVKN